MKRTPELEVLLRAVGRSHVKLVEAAVRAEVIALIQNDAAVRNAIVNVVQGACARGVVKITR